MTWAVFRSLPAMVRKSLAVASFASRAFKFLIADSPNSRRMTSRTLEPLTRRAATALTPAGVIGATIVWESMRVKIANR